MAVAEVQAGLLNLGLRLLDRRQHGVGAGLLHAHLLGTVLHRLLRLEAGLCETLLRLANRLLAANYVSLGLEHRSGGAAGGGDRSVILLLRDHVLLHQRGVTVDVELRLERVGLRLGDARLGGLELLLCLRDGSLAAGHVRTRGADAGQAGDAGDGHGDVGLDVLGLGAGQVGLGLIERDLIIPGVDLGDQLPLLDLLVVLDIDLDDLADDAGADLIEVAIDLGVVGVLDEGGVPVEEAGADHQQNDDGDDDELAPRLLRRGLRVMRACVLRSILLRVAILNLLVCQGYFPPR